VDDAVRKTEVSEPGLIFHAGNTPARCIKNKEDSNKSMLPGCHVLHLDLFAISFPVCIDQQEEQTYAHRMHVDPSPPIDPIMEESEGPRKGDTGSTEQNPERSPGFGLAREFSICANDWNKRE